MTHTLLTGTILNGKYKILSILGEGAFGITYKTQHTYIRVAYIRNRYYATVLRVTHFSKVRHSQNKNILEGYFPTIK